MLITEKVAWLGAGSTLLTSMDGAEEGAGSPRVAGPVSRVGKGNGAKTSVALPVRRDFTLPGSDTVSSFPHSSPRINEFTRPRIEIFCQPVDSRLSRAAILAGRDLYFASKHHVHVFRVFETA